MRVSLQEGGAELRVGFFGRGCVLLGVVHVGGRAPSLVAVIDGQRRIEIIHGAGTGRLKSAIREYLNGLDVVKSFSDSPTEEGGGNKTIVMFEAG